MAAQPKFAVLPGNQPDGSIAVGEPHHILTPQQLADRLHRELSWVYKHTETGCRNPLPVLRCDGFILFYWPEVWAWLRGQK